MLRRIAPVIFVFVVNLCIGLPHLFAQRTSQNTPPLKEYLRQHPDADANHDGILTEEEAKAHMAKMQKGKKQEGKKQVIEYEIAPTHANIKYGPYERNVLDLWLAKREDGKPTPLAIFIHPGGFTTGDKSNVPMEAIRRYRAAGISVAAINYRLIASGPLPIPMQDAARALQFLRYHADEYHLNKNRIACFGGSSGGCISLWLAFHDDLADPKNPDPVLRESTRLTCAAPSNVPTSLNLKTQEEWFGCKLQRFPLAGRAFGVASEKELEKPEKIALMNEVSAITHLTADDPPVFASYTQANTPVDETTSPEIWVHHPLPGIKLKEQMDRLHVECHLQYQGSPPDAKHKSAVDFVIDKLNK